MKQFFDALETWLKNSATVLPLELSTFLGGFIEEVIAPIPSPFVMAAVGSAAFAQSKEHLTLLWLALIGSLGKTLGAWIIYYIADKLEDIFVGKFGRFLGISHQEIENLGKHFSGSWKDAFIIFILRALPIIPSSPVSAMAGLIKLNLQSYLVATFLGNWLRNLIYIYLGYVGLSATGSVLSGLDSFESIMQIAIFIGLLSLVAWFYYRRSKGKGLDWFKKR